jgi:hypothetical protein
LIPGETRRRLVEWGIWAAGFGVSGFPMLSAFMRINSGSRSTATMENPECVRTDQIVGRAELRLRKVLIRHYCTRGSVREKAERARLPKSTYHDLVEEASWFVHTEYDKAEVAVPDSRRYIRAAMVLPSLDLTPIQEHPHGS